MQIASCNCSFDTLFLFPWVGDLRIWIPDEPPESTSLRTLSSYGIVRFTYAASVAAFPNSHACWSRLSIGELGGQIRCSWGREISVAHCLLISLGQLCFPDECREMGMLKVTCPLSKTTRPWQCPVTHLRNIWKKKKKVNSDPPAGLICSRAVATWMVGS